MSFFFHSIDVSRINIIYSYWGKTHQYFRRRPDCRAFAFGTARATILKTAAFAAVAVAVEAATAGRCFALAMAIREQSLGLRDYAECREQWGQSRTRGDCPTKWFVGSEDI